MELTPRGLPIIDLSPINKPNEIAEHIAKACEDSGCFYVKNHGIDSSTINNVVNDLRLFFNQPTDYKLRYVDASGNLDRGYEPFETRNVNAFMGRTGLPNDPLEKYAFGPPAGFVRQVPPNIWPAVPPSVKSHVELCYVQFRQLAEKLMKLFSIGARAPYENFFYDQCYQGEHILRANFYPRNTQPKPMQTTRFGEHTDSTPFTILAMDESKKSLQVQNGTGQWVYADPVPDTLFVNLGDFMAIWTNDKWTATVHKVAWPEEDTCNDRISLAFFLLMNPGAVAECLESYVESGVEPKYKPTSHADYTNARMARLSGRY